MVLHRGPLSLSAVASNSLSDRLSFRFFFNSTRFPFVPCHGKVSTVAKVLAKMFELRDHDVRRPRRYHTIHDRNCVRTYVRYRTTLIGIGVRRASTTAAASRAAMPSFTLMMINTLTDPRRPRAWPYPADKPGCAPHRPYLVEDLEPFYPESELIIMLHVPPSAACVFGTQGGRQTS